MKSNVMRCVVGLYGSLLQDFSHLHPTMRQEYERLDRLYSIVSDRGLAFMTITLPDCGKFLERGLAAGTLDVDRPPYHGVRSKSDARPTFLWGLWSMVFDDAGMLRQDPSVEAIFALRQLYGFAKKLKLDCTKERIDEALIEFSKVDASLPTSYADTWDSDIPNWTPLTGHPLWGTARSTGSGPLFEDSVPSSKQLSIRNWVAFKHLCAFVCSQFGVLDPWSIRPKHGPGAVADLDGNIKYDTRHYPEKLAMVFPPDWHVSPDLVDRTYSKREYPSKVLVVPKTQKAPRIIAAEPTAHQWIQGGIQRWLTDRIRASTLSLCIDLNDQRPSQRMALEASAGGHLATVDLSAASDRLSTRLVQYVFQSNESILDALHASRTRLAKLPSGEQIRLRKFACMGSACTFPVQTIVFAIIAMYSVMESTGDYTITTERVRELASQVRIFGDDMIVPTESYDALVSILTDVGLKVNVHKSFSKGFFRESCGMDAYQGYDVTPAYFLQPYSASNPESLVSIIECSNNFHMKGMWNAADYLLKTVDPQVRKHLRVSKRDVSQPSLSTFVDGVPNGMISRWNPDLHCTEYKQLLISAREKKRRGSGEASLLQYFTEEPDPYTPYESGQAMRAQVMVRLGWAP